jgi:glycosyltransferase involved in cell wall biosynthesis
MQLPPPVHGVSVMSKIIYESKLVQQAFRCRFIDLSTSKAVTDLQKQKFYKWLRAFKLFVKTSFCLLFFRYKKVYITVFPYGPGFMKDMLIVLLTRLFFQKPILHIHSYGFRKFGERSRIRTFLYKLVFRNAEVICLSKLLVEDITPFFKGKVSILPNGVPCVNMVNEYTINSGKTTLLYLSNLIRGKGIYLVLEALANLIQRGYQLQLRIAGPEGDVTYADLKNEVQRLQLTESVVFLGPKFGSDKYKEYQQADIFLLPSDYDTFGLVLLDAMQFGVPAISSPIGGIPDVLGEGRGVLVERIDGEALTRAIEGLVLSPEKRLAISTSAFDFFHKNYTTAVFERRLIAILNDSPETSLEV